MTYYMMTEDVCQIVRDIIGLYSYLKKGTPGMKLSTTPYDDESRESRGHLEFVMLQVLSYESQVKNGDWTEIRVSLKRCADWRRCVRVMVRDMKR
jgi:hypothetical protein